MSVSRLPVLLTLTVAPWLASCGREGAKSLVDLTVNTPAGARASGARWSPDGARLAFERTVEGRSGIWVQDADGLNPVRLTHGVWDSAPFWSPDGKWVAYQAESPSFDVMVVSADGGDPRALTTDPAQEYPIGWMPDGSGVVYMKVGDNIETLVAMLADGSRRPLVTADGTVEAQPSPDGTTVAYELSKADGTLTVWVWDVATKAHRQLTFEGREALDEGRAWSPDSRSLLFRSSRTGTPDLWIADVNTGDLRQLTTDVQADFGGRWSPDGRWVAFVSERGGQTDVWVVPAGGGDALRVTDDLAIEFGASLTWTPDGRSLTYVTSDEVPQVRVLPVDGGEPRLVSFDDYQAAQPQVSPDGSAILFASNRSGNFDVWVAPISGGSPHALTSSPLGDAGARWAPDGRSIVFQSNRRGSPDLFVVADTGGEPRLLVDWPRTSEGRPMFSPDGRAIAFQSTRDARTSDVWLVPAAGGEPTRLTRFDASTTLEEWSPDGRSVLVTTGGTSSIVYRVALSGGAPERLAAPIGARTPTWSPDDKSITYTELVGGYSYLGVLTLGGQATRLTKVEQSYDLNPRWSPDGTMIAWDAFDLPNSAEDIHVITLADGAVRKVTSTPDVGETSPRWTPDGRSLVIQYSRFGNSIVTANVERLLTAAAGGAAKH